MNDFMKNKDFMDNNYPVLINWEVKYDDYFAMPEYIQGKMIGQADKYPKLSNGEVVNIRDIEVFDMFNKVLRTSTGQRFYLSGSGRRVFSEKIEYENYE
jgi:hypothetical protein